MTIDKEDQDDDEVTFKLRWLRFCSATTLTLDLLMNQFQQQLAMQAMRIIQPQYSTKTGSITVENLSLLITALC